MEAIDGVGNNNGSARCCHEDATETASIATE
jgi:hypothetical protein